MTETVLVYGIVLGAVAFLALRWLPRRLGSRGGGSACASKSGCGSRDCDGCR
ncbi:MAG: hypothetical protein OEL76_09165 [Siculibacillus sp.]|nr:hypothetical protein [Siculibacillus sp.]